MSGIAAIFNQSGLPTEAAMIAKMASIMAEQGPLKQHYWCDKNIALAHCLLDSSLESIEEEQPSNIARDYWITADARLDDRAHLVKKLRANSSAVSLSTTDDQLILNSFLTWGVDCLEHLIGDFAFILWDAQRSRLFCATDHFGVAPLYYSRTKNGVCLSNSINAIRIHPDTSNDLDELAVADYLMARTNENPNSTIFKNIKRVAGGHFLMIDSNNLTLRSYWRPKPRGKLHRANADTYIEEFSELLNLAVADRVRTKGVGTHLSGGMDSTSVTAIASRAISKNDRQTHIKAYTSAASGTHEDLETPIAKEVADSLNIDHRIMKKKEMSFDYEPPNTKNIFPEPYNLGHNPKPHQILKDVQGFGSVLLTGFGGDPLLRGEPLKLNDVNTPSSLCFITQQALLHFKLFSERPRIGSNRKLKIALNANPVSSPAWINEHFSKEFNLSERLHSRAHQRVITRNSQAGMFEEGTWRRIFCWNDPGFTNIPVKVRHPFFDLRLFEYTQSLPRFPWLHNKQILRGSMASLLPTSVIQRPKTALPSFRALDTLKEKGVPSHFYELLNSHHLKDYVDTLYLTEKLKHIEECNHFDIRGIMNTLGLSHWLLEYKNTPANLESIKGYINVTRIY